MSDNGATSEFEAAQREFLAMVNELRRARGEEPLAAIPGPPFCNFCGRSKSEVRAMVEVLAPTEN